MALFHDCVTKYIIDTSYLTRYMQRRIDDYIRDPSERLGHYDDIVYMNTLDWEE